MVINMIALKHKIMIILRYKAAAGVLILLSCGMLLTGCGAAVDEAVKEIPAVKVMELKKASLTVTVDYPSRLLPSQDIDIAAKIPGRVSNVYFSIGSAVKKGDILFTLEAEDSKSQLQQSEAALSGTTESIRQQLLQAETNLSQAQLRYDDAKDAYEKAETLYMQGAVSKQQRDDSETALKNATVNLEAAKDNLNILTGNGQGKGLAAAQASQARSAVNAASVQVENSVIRSPIDGEVSACNVKAGELTSSAMTAYTVINSGDLTAEINVPAEVQAVLKPGMALKLKAGISEEKELDGVVSTISPAADSKTGFYNVKITLQNKDGAVKPGSFARVVVPVLSKNGIFTVPGGAIVAENGIEYLFEVRDGTVVKKIVQTGVSTETATEVQGELNEGDRIILEGQNFLSEGEKVEAVGGR